MLGYSRKSPKSHNPDKRKQASFARCRLHSLGGPKLRTLRLGDGMRDVGTRKFIAGRDGVARRPVVRSDGILRQSYLPLKANSATRAVFLVRAKLFSAPDWQLDSVYDSKISGQEAIGPLCEILISVL